MSSVDGSDLVINVAYRSDAVAGRSDVVEGRITNVTEPEWSAEVVEYNVVYRHAVACRSDVVEGRITNVTEPEWSAEVVEYNVVYRRMISSDRSIAVDIHVHDTTKQDQSLHSIVYGRSKNLANRQRT